MKVVLKETVIDRILQQINDAGRARRKVDYIVVRPAEYRELCADDRSMAYLDRPWYRWDPDIKLADTKFTVRDFKIKRPSAYEYGGDRRRVASEGKFMDYDLFVVPEYCEETST